VTRSILVVGAGAAGLAAAWAARRNGHRVTVIAAGLGATSLGGGALDDVPWESALRAARLLGAHSHTGATLTAPLPEQIENLAQDLGLWELPRPPYGMPHLATLAGRIRPARGYDRSLLDLSRIEGGRVVIPRVSRAMWDADFLGAAFSADPFAKARGLHFEPVDLPVLRYDIERRIADGDLAARHDDEARLDWLAERVREHADRARRGGRPVAAVLLGPWLGASAPRATALSEQTGVSIGEALAGAGSPAGLRFEAARDRLFASLDVSLINARVITITVGPDGVTATLEQPQSADLEHRADAVVLAIGGLASGGVIYTPPEHTAEHDLPLRGAVSFALSLRAPVTLATADGPLDVVSSLHGPDLDATAWPSADRAGVLETVGIQCRGVRAGPSIVAAGDVIAAAPRTLLEALATGIRAGSEA
jgi:glycerol-3-phosphate dehydrogenase subunit B